MAVCRDTTSSASVTARLAFHAESSSKTAMCAASGLETFVAPRTTTGVATRVPQAQLRDDHRLNSSTEAGTAG